jgi:hypothetical protein
MPNAAIITVHANNPSIRANPICFMPTEDIRYAKAARNPAVRPKNFFPAKKIIPAIASVASAPGSNSANQFGRRNGEFARAASHVNIGGFDVTSP